MTLTNLVKTVTTMIATVSVTVIVMFTVTLNLIPACDDDSESANDGNIDVEMPRTVTVKVTIMQ